MHIKELFLVLLNTCSAHFLLAQVPQNGLDVQHYRFAVEINDSNDVIHCNAQVTARFIRDVHQVELDLIKEDEGGKGMTVSSVTKDRSSISFRQDSQHLIIEETATIGSESVYEIVYEGEPADGLIISKNKFGNRTFFCDHWPDRAHNWLPCNDHLSDKASVEFIVIAPDHYQVVGNGLQVEENNLPNHLKLTHWKEDVPIATKVMAIGAADFAVSLSGFVDCIPVTSWVYPENKENGFKSYAKAKDILSFLKNKVGPYAYQKLANIQSKTRFGALENADAVFYTEASVDDKGVEALLAHEVTHQWFGNSATETDWPHLWLSEGFATYMTHLYHEYKYGADSLNSRLKEDRKKIIEFSGKENIPVVDTISLVKPMKLLNANSYEKGSWVLHMLRRKIGDSLFWKGLRTYYATYSGHNANTEDLRKVFEEVSNQSLAIFFKQWIYTPGQPMLNIGWKYNETKKTVMVKIEQTQKSLFEFPIEIVLRNGDKTISQTLQLKNKLTQEEIPLSFVPDDIIPDPDTDLLFDEKLSVLK